MVRSLSWLALAAVAAAFSGGGAPPVALAPAAGHRIAGIGLDRDWLAVAEDATGSGCARVELVRLPATTGRTLTTASGPTCALHGEFWSSRPVANALQTVVWVVRRGGMAEAVEAKKGMPETALVTQRGIGGPRGPFLGPVVGTNWLTLFGAYTRGMDGKLVGGAISGNDRELWADDGTPVPTGLDDQEHAVAVGADGSIAMWQAHGARYGRVADAHARTAALDAGRVYVLRSDAPRLDVRLLSGKLVRSWPVARSALPLLDVAGSTAVYCVGRDVHELDVATGGDRVVATAPARLLDAQVERGWLVYATAAKVYAVRR
ncbi:MAG TPA: hypothetical protein VHD91_07770 [Gaiellaceae bacterium]|nr:hypothetical protein [Gaiellaceae bacterium]